MNKKFKYNLNTEVRLDKYLSDHLLNLSRTKIQKLIQLGSVQVDDYIVKSSYKLTTPGPEQRTTFKADFPGTVERATILSCMLYTNYFAFIDLC